MTTSSSTSRRIAAALTLLMVFVMPGMAFAAVRITNVMYDPSGADQGREWIQLTNQGAEPVNLYGYRLFEGGVNHKLTTVVGTSTLAAGAVAIVATDPSQYAADHPSFAGTIFKSSFSLSNTGETIALKDAKLQQVDSYTYQAPPPAPKVVAAKPATITTAKKTTKAAQVLAGNAALAASPLFAKPALPQIPSVWLYSFALAALLLVGACGLVYAKLTAPQAVTFMPQEEFELE